MQRGVASCEKQNIWNEIARRIWGETGLGNLRFLNVTNLDPFPDPRGEEGENKFKNIFKYIWD